MLTETPQIVLLISRKKGSDCLDSNLAERQLCIPYMIIYYTPFEDDPSVFCETGMAYLDIGNVIYFGSTFLKLRQLC
jgi:hypothetical protein